MISFPAIVVATIIQLFVILFVLIVGLYFSSRHLKTRLKMIEDENSTSSTKDGLSDTEHYLTTEIKLTDGRYDVLFSEEQVSLPTLSEPDWLKLRVSYLTLEKELLSDKEREDAFWLRLGEGIKSILAECHLVKRLPVPEESAEDEDDAKELKKMMKFQSEELESIINYLDVDKQDALSNELKEKLHKIADSHRELSHCIFVLEDENLFLRDQIHALLD